MQIATPWNTDKFENIAKTKTEIRRADGKKSSFLYDSKCIHKLFTTVRDWPAGAGAVFRFGPQTAKPFREKVITFFPRKNLPTNRLLGVKAFDAIR